MNASPVKVTITNQQVIEKLIYGLSDIDREKSIKSGLGRGGEILKQRGMQRLRSRMKTPSGVTGNLLRSFAVRVKRRKPGVLSGFRTGKGGGAHSFLVDLGTGERHHESGRSTGSAKGLFYWSDTTEDILMAEKEVLTGIELFVEKLKERI